MERIILSDNHRRSFTSALMVIERSLNEMEDELKKPTNLCLSKIIVDISNEEKEVALRNIKRAKKLIVQFSVKYGLETRTSLMRRFIDSRKSHIWEVLCGTTSRRLKGYGEFPREYAKEFDDDIDKLQNMVASI